MKVRVSLTCSLVAIACLLLVSPAAANNLSQNPKVSDPPLLPNGIWNIVDDPGVCNGCFFPETWTAAASETVYLTDLFVVGDSYGVYLNGTGPGNFVFNTPSVPDWTFYGSNPYGYPYTTDPNLAINSGLFSSAIFFVTEGTTINLTELSLPTGFSDGTYAIMASPEPASIALFGSGLLGLAGFARRKFRR